MDSHGHVFSHKINALYVTAFRGRKTQYSLVLELVRRRKRKMACVETRSVRPSVCDVVSATKPVVGFSCNLGQDVFTRS